MMLFQPSKTTGLAIGLGALAGLLAACAGALALLLTQPVTALTAAWLGVLAAAAPALGWLAYRLAGLANARYELTAHELSVVWGGRRVVIPLADIEEARLAAEFPGALIPPPLNWPGCYIGQVQQPELGALEFLTTRRDKAGLVLIGYADGWLALSPPAPAAFLAALTGQPAAAGPVEPQQPAPAPLPAPALPAPAPPALTEWAVWRDRWAVALLAGGGAALLALAGYLLLIFPQLPAQIALRFDPNGQPLRFGPPAGLFTLVSIGAVAWGVNAVLGILVHRRAADRPAAYLLFGAAVVVQGLLWVAALGLLTAGA